MGIAASMGAGVIEANRTGGTVKRIHCGWAAHGGVTAAVLAREGVTGPPTVLEGRFGFFQAYLDGRYDEHAMLDGLGERWELLRTVYKPYPSQPLHPPGHRLRARPAQPRHRPRRHRVGRARRGRAQPLRTIAEPREDKIRPRTPYHAKFSGPFTVARALLGGGGLGPLPRRLHRGHQHRPARARARRQGAVRGRRARQRDLPARVRGRAARADHVGRTCYEHRVDSSRGGPEHPLSRSDLLVKFRLNAGRALPTAQVEAIVEAAERLTTDGDAADLLELTRVGRYTIPSARSVRTDA